MLQYIYFVKCPDFEDESFDFFDEAKSFALNCLSSKPVICQVEVDRNDFGECVSSNDLGTIWSWEDVMGDDTDFTDTVDAGSTPNAFDLDFEEPDVSGENSILDTVPDNFRKPIPADMAIEDLVEAMEENEEMVECKECFNLVAKESCTKSDHGYVCKECAGTPLEEDGPSLRDIANIASAEYGDKYTEQDILDAAGVVDSDAFADIDTFNSINMEEPFTKYAMLRRIKAKKQRERAMTESFNIKNYEIPGLDLTVTGEFDKDGVKVYELTYSVKGKYFTHVQVFEDSPEVIVIDDMRNHCLLDGAYGSFRGFAYEASYAARFYAGADTDFNKYRNPISEDFTDAEDFEDDEDTVQCTWCEDTFDRSECRYEVDLGWLCSRCEAAIKSRGETLTFREGSYFDFLDESDKPELRESLVLCPECGAVAFDRVAEACKNCGFDTKKIMLEDVPLNFVQGDAKKEVADAAATDAKDDSEEPKTTTPPPAPAAPAGGDNKDTPVDTKALADEITAKLNKEYEAFQTEVTNKVTQGLEQAADAMVDAVKATSEKTVDKFVEVGRVLAGNDQKIYDSTEKIHDAVEDIMFELT